MRRVAVWTVLLVALAGADDCSPPNPVVHTFTVEPTVVCPGGEVTVTWHMSGGVPLLYSSATVDPAQVLAGDFSQLTLETDQGSKTFTVTENTTFKAASYHSEGHVAPSKAIQVSMATTGVEQATFPACKGSATWGSWSTKLDPVPAGLVVGDVVNETPPLPGQLVGPAITMQHDGETLEVPGSSVQPAPAGLAYGGPWSASMQLAAGVGCPSNDVVMGSGPPPVKPPDLQARIKYVCP